MMSSSFFAMLSRMKYISRWSLMRNVERESLSEHSLETAMIAHALAVLRNTRFGGNVNAERVALLALFHDVTETMTGDMPTPVKYTSARMRAAYGEVEESASQRLMAMVPEDLADVYIELVCQDEESEEHRLVKAADRLSALIKCVEERKAGNTEFISAQKSTLEAIEKMDLPEAMVFIEEFLPAYSLTLDEL